MISLNLPTYEIKISGTPERPTILDILRRKYVALTPGRMGAPAFRAFSDRAERLSRHPNGKRGKAESW